MESNPFYDLAALLRPDAANADWRLTEGTVTAAAPLQVTAFGLAYAGRELQVNAQLLGGWAQQVRIDQGQGQIQGRLTAQGPALQPGDRVLVLTADGQTLYILCKVVSG